MYKSISVLAVILAIIAFVSGSKPIDASPIGTATPVIVARGKLLNQTAPIPVTTLFTPSARGLYRLSVYGTTTKADPTSTSGYNYNLFWTDISGASNYYLDAIASFDSFAGNWNQTCCAVPTGMEVFQAEEGTAVTYQVTQSGPPDKAIYSLYWTVERLE
jgi:hypothetical protein